MSKLGKTCAELNSCGKCKADCCGPVGFDIEIYKKNYHKRQLPVEKVFRIDGKIRPITESGKCLFLDSKTHSCRIYEDRPEVCRTYGTVEELQCPYIKLNGNERSPAGKRQMQRKINRYVTDSMKMLEKSL